MSPEPRVVGKATAHRLDRRHHKACGRGAAKRFSTTARHASHRWEQSKRMLVGSAWARAGTSARRQASLAGDRVHTHRTIHIIGRAAPRRIFITRIGTGPKLSRLRLSRLVAPTLGTSWSVVCRASQHSRSRILGTNVEGPPLVSLRGIIAESRFDALRLRNNIKAI